MPSVLILEDNILFLETLIDSFSDLGFEVHGFSEIPPVLSAAQQQNFDLFVTDIRIENAKASDIPGWQPYETQDALGGTPGQKVRVTQPDGIHCLQAVRQIRPKIPSIVVTGFAPDHSTLRMLRLQVQGHIVKGFLIDELKTVVDTVLAEHAQRSLLSGLYFKTIGRFFRSEEEKTKEKLEACRANVHNLREQFYSEYYISIQSRLYSRNVALTLWDRLCPLEKTWQDYGNLNLEQAAELHSGFSALLSQQRQFSERSGDGQTQRPESAHLDRSTLYRIFQQIEQRTVSTQEFSYAYWITTLEPEKRSSAPKIQELYRKLQIAPPSVGVLEKPRQNLGI